MKYIINHSNDTAFNIALEEYAFKHLLDEDQIFLLWINKPSIIVDDQIVQGPATVDLGNQAKLKLPAKMVLSLTKSVKLQI